MSRRVTLTVLAILLLTAAGGAVIFQQYTQSRDALIEGAERHLQQAVGDAAREANRVLLAAVSTANQLHASDLRDLDLSEAERVFFAIGSYPVLSNSQLLSVYVAMTDGSFLQVQH